MNKKEKKKIGFLGIIFFFYLISFYCSLSRRSVGSFFFEDTLKKEVEDLWETLSRR